MLALKPPSAFDTTQDHQARARHEAAADMRKVMAAALRAPITMSAMQVASGAPVRLVAQVRAASGQPRAVPEPAKVTSATATALHKLATTSPRAFARRLTASIAKGFAARGWSLPR